MKAKVYKTKKNGIDVIASSFINSNEFVTIYCSASEFYSPIFHNGGVHYEPKTQTLEQHIEKIHPGATPIESKNNIGEIYKNVWRPGLNINVDNSLETKNEEFNRNKRELRILIEKLKEILLYIEPCNGSMTTFGHKLRELLILTCTSIESSWLSYLKIVAPQIQRATTQDYIKLKDILMLSMYKVTFISHPFSLKFKPFESWSASTPTQTLPWYDAYNKTKHDSQLHFDKSSLENCIMAIGSLIIMQCVRFGPYKILEGQEITTQLINEHFSIEIENPAIDEFYTPPFKSLQVAHGAFSAPLATQMEKDWIINAWSI